MSVLVCFQNAVVMGRKTWFSIPEKFRPLPKRINIVLSRELPEAPEGTHLAHSFTEAMRMLNEGPLGSSVESVFVIGGSSVYAEAMMSGEFPCRLYMTRILGDFTCDTFLPSVDDYKFRKVPNPDDIPVETLHENGIDFKFEVYEKD